LQYPYSSKKCQQRVRSWFLWLVVKNESLSCAVSSLSALHRQTISCWPQKGNGEDLVTYHTRALGNLHKWLKAQAELPYDLDSNFPIELMAVGSSLVSFEVCVHPHETSLCDRLTTEPRCSKKAHLTGLRT
jgi:hypothetical protein